MRDQYDFSKGTKNPYSAKLKQQVTINLDSETVDYFKEMSARTDIPYQKLINFYLAECVREKKTLAWIS